MRLQSKLNLSIKFSGANFPEKAARKRDFENDHADKYEDGSDKSPDGTIIIRTDYLLLNE